MEQSPGWLSILKEALTPGKDVMRIEMFEAVLAVAPCV